MSKFCTWSLNACAFSGFFKNISKSISWSDNSNNEFAFSKGIKITFWSNSAKPVLKIDEIINFSCRGKLPNGVWILDVDINVISSPTNKSDDIESTIDNIKSFTDNLPVITEKFTDLSNQLELVLLNLNEGDGTLSKIIRDDELYNNTNNLVVETTNLIGEVKAEIDGIANNANSVVNNLNSVIDNVNNIVEEFSTDKGFKKYVKLYLKAEKEFKREEKKNK